MKNVILMLLIAVPFNLLSKPKSKTVEAEQAKLTVTEWRSEIEHTVFPANDEAIILLSGPTDNWNSDSAWYARLAPKLAKTNRTFTIDRAGQILADRSASLGYLEFGKAIHTIIESMDLDKILFVAFASSNLSVLQYLQLNPKHSQLRILLIDPDVLLPYSISRYGLDAKPFKENLAKYTEYIQQGKYDQRAKEKNDFEMLHLKELAQSDPDVDWDYVEQTFNSRLKHNNLINLFGEIAIYHTELLDASKWIFPKNIPVTIIDTNFEKTYIENAKTEQEKKALIQWKDEAKRYYQSITTASNSGRYMELETTEHLIPFSSPQLILNWVKQSDSN